VELEALLQCLFIYIVGSVLDDDNIIVLADYSALFGFWLRLPQRLVLKLQGC
jgi:hypothetical protein